MHLRHISAKVQPKDMFITVLVLIVRGSILIEVGLRPPAPPSPHWLSPWVR